MDRRELDKAKGLVCSDLLEAVAEAEAEGVELTAEEKAIIEVCR
jgi:hypothetical protein